MRKLAMLTLLCICIPASAKEEPEMYTAKVLYQKIGVSESGVVGIPIGNIVAAVPIRTPYNVVILDTGKYVIELHENGRRFITLPVKGDIECYQDGNLVVVLDNKGRKHKFAVVHVEVKEPD